MKSFLSLFRHFIIAFIVVIFLGIYVWVKQPSEPSVTAKVPPSPPISFTPLNLPSPPISPTLLPNSPTPLIKESKPFPIPSSHQVATGTDDIYEFPTVSPHSPPVAPKSTQTGLPTHFFYQENAQNLVEVGIYFNRREFLNREVAEAFKQMQLAAQKEKIEIVPISGFRSIADQKKLFQRQIQRRGSEEAASRLSAPPGFSEHHTGYALDISDSKHHETDLKVAFDSTKAYRWLKDHAAQYGFELSFPENNPQGVAYEPWHWRFVGSPKAQEIFRLARSVG